MKLCFLLFYDLSKLYTSVSTPLILFFHGLVTIIFTSIHVRIHSTVYSTMNIGMIIDVDRFDVLWLPEDADLRTYNNLRYLIVKICE